MVGQLLVWGVPVTAFATAATCKPLPCIQYLTEDLRDKTSHACCWIIQIVRYWVCYLPVALLAPIHKTPPYTPPAQVSPLSSTIKAATCDTVSR